jgi:ParB family chromosome partitioning protein
MEDIERLRETIGKVGLIHNLKVKPIEDGFYEIISGERRYRAICSGIENEDPRFNKFRLGIPCMVEDKTLDDVTEEIQLIIAKTLIYPTNGKI